MFRTNSNNREPLFSKRNLRDVLIIHNQSMQGEIEQIATNQLLNTSPEDLTNFFVEKYTLTTPSLLRANWTLSETETKIDVSSDPERWIPDRSRPFQIPGQRLEIEIPVEGEIDFLDATPSQFSTSLPYAQKRGNSIVLTFEVASNSKQRDIRQEANRILDEIDQYLLWTRKDIEGFNASLPELAKGSINSRRERILTNQGRVAALGIPLKVRNDSPLTYAVPDIRRRIGPILPKASTAQYEPEPVLEMNHYEHILTVIQSMAHVIERSPSSFQTMGEEDLRQHFLVQLNGHFEGAATGETFNMSGRSDILLRANDRNIFIAECKFWTGSKHYSDTIDQLLGYTSWRDTKTAILVFNRTVTMSTVLEGVQSVTTHHENFKRAVEWKHESGFRYILHHKSDSNRELLLTVLVFDVPK